MGDFNNETAPWIITDTEPGKWQTDNEMTARIIIEDIERLRRQIEALPQPKICLMNPLTVMECMRHDKFGKDFTWCGIPVEECDTIEYGKILIMNEKDYLDFKQNHAGEQQPETESKPEVKAYHCRVCGARYFSKQEAKECQRSHEWQNRKGRR